MFASCLSHLSVLSNKNKARVGLQLNTDTAEALFCMFLIFNSPPATSFIILSLLLSISFSLFFPIKGSQCLQLFGCRHVGQKFWHCVV